MNLELFDIRHIDRFLEEGKVTPEAYQKYLDALEDCAEDTEVSSVRFIASDPTRRPMPGDATGPEEEG